MGGPPKTRKRSSVVAGMGILALLILFPLVVKDPYSLHLANMMAIMSLMCLSVNLIFGYAGQIALGNAAFFGIGAYCAALLEIHAGMSFWLSTPIASLLAFAIGYLIGVPTLRLKHAYLAMATVAFNLIFDVVVTNWTDLTSGPAGLVNIPKVTFFYRPLVGAGYYYLCVSSLLLCLLLCRNLINSRVGRALLAIREQEEAASSLGVSTSHYKVVSFGLSAAFAAWAGSLHAHLLSFVSPEPFRVNYSVLFLFMVVIGGKGSNMGAILGAIALTLLPEFLHGFEDYSLLVYGMVILVFMVFLPKGLIGLRFPIKALSLRVTRLRS
jgi:branched-chain amino acid transport system permease protein